MTADEVLELIPQKDPFRFIDKIIELDEQHIIGTYKFKENEYFYRGHFPGNPVTPGVILVETMAQTGVVALGIYLTSLKMPKEEVAQWTTFFTDCQMDFYLPVLPGQSVIAKGELVFWRRMKLKSKVRLFLENGDLAAEGTVSGMGVKNE